MNALRAIAATEVTVLPASSVVMAMVRLIHVSNTRCNKYVPVRSATRGRARHGVSRWRMEGSFVGFQIFL